MAFSLKNYKIEESRIDTKNVLLFVFANDLQLRRELKEFLPHVRWSSSSKVWWVYDNASVRSKLGLLPRDFTGEDMMQRMSADNAFEFNIYLDELYLKAYSANTIKTYATEFAQLLYILKDISVKELSTEKLRSYLLYCIKELKLSENQIHSRLNALKFYFEHILKKDKFFYDIPRPKKVQALPKVLSTREILRLFESVNNLKHLMMLKMCYGLGLRVSEVANLKVTDIDSDRMVVLVACAKNKKDRYVPLPAKILDELRNYYINYKPKEYLFEGQHGGAIALRSVQAVFKCAMIKAKIKKKVGIHGLRHSYATHLLEYGTDMSFIQKLLGHNHISTTLIYAQVSNKALSNVQSPLDRL